MNVVAQLALEIFLGADECGLEAERHDDGHDGEPRGVVVVVAELLDRQDAGEDGDGDDADGLDQQIGCRVPEGRLDDRFVVHTTFHARPLRPRSRSEFSTDTIVNIWAGAGGFIWRDA
jgi:hypothetical protein